ncbi:hypothetical protein RJ639_003366 [Escallonia herrerae]|uniref:Uncharacterized protein n=1 Tax=Escallonia herrerae TaxID=1293975 RepID=A0AA89AZ12_9ASTE|nr:hypothetical protein RJ639_003366 [Escallonia herrerae]
MSYTIEESTVHHHGTMLVIKLYCKRKLGDRYIGEVHASMKELYDIACACEGSAIWSFPVQKGSVKSQGALKFSFRFGDKVRYRTYSSKKMPANATNSELCLAWKIDKKTLLDHHVTEEESKV